MPVITPIALTKLSPPAAACPAPPFILAPNDVTNQSEFRTDSARKSQNRWSLRACTTSRARNALCGADVRDIPSSILTQHAKFYRVYKLHLLLLLYHVKYRDLVKPGIPIGAKCADRGITLLPSILPSWDRFRCGGVRRGGRRGRSAVAPGAFASRDAQLSVGAGAAPSRSSVRAERRAEIRRGPEKDLLFPPLGGCAARSRPARSRAGTLSSPPVPQRRRADRAFARKGAPKFGAAPNGTCFFRRRCAARRRARARRLRSGGAPGAIAS